MPLFSAVLLWLGLSSELTSILGVLCFSKYVFHLNFLLFLLLQMDSCFQLRVHYAFLTSWKYVAWFAFSACYTAGESLLKLWPGGFR